MKNRLPFRGNLLFSFVIVLICSLPELAADYVPDEVDHAKTTSLWRAEFYENYNHETFPEFHP